MLGEPLAITSQLREASEALVLTEWKLVKDVAEVDRKAQQARAQASQYAAGVLAGFELASVRYLVLVSRDAIQLPPDDESNGVTYRHVNIAIAPSVPSRSKVTRGA